MGLPAALALIVLGQALGFQAGPDELTLTADHIQVETDTERVDATGHVELTGQGISLRASHVRYDAKAHTIAADKALVVRGRTAAISDHVDLDLDTFDSTLAGGLFLQKRSGSPEALRSATTPEELIGLGQNQLALRGVRVRRIGENEVEVDHLSFTPCDCNPAHPSWRIDARRADVKLNDAVFLSWPVIYVHGVPVLAFPALYLPLSDRRSGLLIPKPGRSTLNGFSIEQPFFLTLGPSYDLTFTPGYFFGGQNIGGVKGPRLVTDFRYVPSTTHHGELELSLIDDLKAPRAPENGGISLPGKRGLRWALSGTDSANLGNGVEERLDLSLASDGFYVFDFTSDVLERQNRYLRSDATVFQRSDDRYVGVAAVFRQDIRYGFDLFERDRTLSGLLGPRTLQELPDAVVSYAQRRIFGDVLGALDLRFTRLSPLVGRFGDEGVQGIYSLSPDDPGAGNRIFDTGEREGRDRLDFHPQLSTHYALGRFLTVTPTLALREDLYAGELTGDTAQRGHAWADLRLDSGISRTFNVAGGITHAVEPSAELRYAPAGWGTSLAAASGPIPSGDGLRPYDEIDEAMPDEGITQLVVQVSQRLSQRTALATREILRLDVGEELDLRAAHPPRDAFARLGSQLGPFNLLAVARYDVMGRRLSELSGSAAFTFAPGSAVHFAYDNLLFGGTARERRGLDTLIGTAYDPAALQRVQLLNGGIGVAVGGGLTLGYDAIVQPTADIPLAQQSFGVSYAPACDCWRLEIQVQAFRKGESTFGSFQVTGGLTISHFGTIGAGG